MEDRHPVRHGGRGHRSRLVTRRARLPGAGPRVRLPDHSTGGAERVTGPVTGPVRTCVGCRRRDQQTDLLRVVRVAGDEGDLAVVDAHRSLPGRGAWVHPDPQCLELAERRRAFARALRAGPIDVSHVRRHLEDRSGRPSA
ncbi:MAG: YlxR family protein [Actinotalea sp.]|nr:YlxR family protein [Actinotalea sp.]